MNNWINQFQNAVDSAVHGIARTADDIADSWRHQARRGANNDNHHDGAPRRRQPQRNAFASPFASRQPPTPDHPPIQHPQRVPPASIRSIRQLPTILVAPEDLVDENNRECCICLEPNELGTKVMRLPCAHIFHSGCIVDWLSNHHCTCPICRFELPTDDPLYEAGRAERMKARKPRFARYELERMSIKELVALNRGCSPGMGEKKDLVQFLIDQERIDLIPTPEPVSYQLSTLRWMKVSELKRTMADAGVFFHAKDVVEKEDMISIFVNSGRLNVMPECKTDDDDEDPNESSVPANNKVDQDPESSVSSSAHRTARRNEGILVVETVDIDPSDEQGQDPLMDGVSPIVMFPTPPSNPAECRVDLKKVPVKAAREPEANRGHDAGITACEIEDCVSHHTEVTPNDDGLSYDPNKEHYHETSNIELPVSANSTNDDVIFEPVFLGVDTEDGNNSSPISSPSDTNGLNSPDRISLVGHRSTLDADNAFSTLSSRDESSVQATHDDARIRSNETPQVPNCPLSNYSIAELRRLGDEANIDLSSCFERSEMVNILVAAGATGQAQVDLQPSSFADWSVSQLRAVASEVNIDVSHCTDQTEIVERIVHEANTERPHLQNYLRTLAPLTTATLPQLRSFARNWNVDLSDCLEKDEIIQRLITRASRFGVF